MDERKPVTVVCMGVPNFESRAAVLDPEDLQRFVAEFEEAVTVEVNRYGGKLERLGPGSAVAVFGAPLAHEDDPVRAVRFSLRIIDCLERLPATEAVLARQVAVGISTGESLVRGGPEAGMGSTWGPVIATAADLQVSAGAGEVLVDAATYVASTSMIAYEKRGAGASDKEEVASSAWLAASIRDIPEAGKRQVSLVGRYAEVGLLLETWTRVLTTGAAAMTVVSGEAGVGKTRLIEEFIRAVDGASDVYRGHCLSYGEGITYWAVREIVCSVAGVTAEDDAEAARLKLHALLDGLKQITRSERVELELALAEVGGFVGDRSPSAATSEAQLRWAVARFVELVAKRRPCLLVVEDVHWAEPALLELLRHVIAGASGPVMLVATARSELSERWSQLEELADTIVLPPLSDRESEALIGALLRQGGSSLRGTVVSGLVSRAGGNPLFAEEMVAMLNDSGVLATDVGSEVEMGSVVPAGLERLIGARLDLLLPEDRQLLGYASVLGMRFSSLVLADLAGDDAAVERSLGQLVSRDLIRSSSSDVRDEQEWAFKHGLVRDVAYARMPKARRAGLHIQVADQLDAAGASEFLELIAYHLEEACVLARQLRGGGIVAPVERAVEALVAAGEKAEWRESLRTAERFYTRALGLATDGEPEQLLTIRVCLGRAVNSLGDLARADEILSRLADEAAAVGRADLQAAALVGMTGIARKQGRAGAARAHVTEAESLAGEHSDRATQIRAKYESAELYAWDEAGNDAIRELRKGMALAQEVGDQAMQIEGHHRLGILLFNAGELRESANQLRRALALARESPRQEARVMWSLALVKYHLGELEEAERLGREAHERLERTGDRSSQVQNLRLLHYCALAKSETDTAERYLQEAAALAAGFGGPLLLEIHRCLVDVLIRQGRASEAREVAVKALKMDSEEDAYVPIAASLIRAAIAALDGRNAEVRDEFQQAIRALEKHRLHLDLGAARLAYGQALRNLGQPDEARRELLRARTPLQRLGARRLLDEIDYELSMLAR